MTVDEFIKLFSTFGMPGVAGAVIFYLWQTGRAKPLGESRLEVDLRALRDEIHDLSDRLSRMEGRMEGKR